MNNETDQSHVSTEGRWDKSDDSETYVRLLLLFGPPPESFFSDGIDPWQSPLTYAGLWQWQKQVQEWLYHHDITTSQYDGSWLRAFLCWYREACREQ